MFLRHGLCGYDVPIKKEINSKKKAIKIPVLGKVIAGIPLEAVEEILGYEEIDEELAKKGDFFGLAVKGDSMFPWIIETDVIIVQKQDDCESGQVAVVLINGDEATVKVVNKNNDGISLVSYNPMYKPLNFTSEEIINKPIKIIGIVKEMRRKNFNT